MWKCSPLSSNMKTHEQFKDSLDVEARFLVDLLRAHVRLESLPVIPKKLIWQKFIQLCYATHYAGIISDLIKAYDSNELPSEVFPKLKSYQLRVLTTNERLLHQYASLKQLANEQHLTLYPLKGITLMPKVYERPYHRHLSDIDVLIDQKDLSRWESLLKTQGFEMKRRYAKSHFHEQMNLKYDPLQAFKQQTVVDFHISLHSGFHHISMPIELLHKNQAHDHELHFVDQFIFVCLHAYKHLYYGQCNVLHLMDIFFMNKQISPPDLWSRCERYKCTKEVQQALDLSLFFFGDARKHVPIWQVNVLQKELMALPFSFGLRQLFFFRKHLQIPVSWKQVPSYLWFQVFPSEAYLRQSDGKGSYWSNWWRRCMRLIWKR